MMMKTLDDFFAEFTLTLDEKHAIIEYLAF